MNNIKKYIGIILIIIVFLIMIIFLRIRNSSKSNFNNELFDQNSGPQDVIKTDIEIIKPIKVNKENTYYNVNSCVSAYLLIMESSEKEVLISYLNEEYVKDNNINANNILEKLETYKNYDGYYTNEIYELNGDTFSTYYVKGKIDLKAVFYEVGIDYLNHTFDIMPIDEARYEDSINKGIQSNEITERIIQKKTYNIVNIQNLNEENIARNYFKNYFKLLLEDVEEAYEKLDSEYKKQRFEDIESFKQYVIDNKGKIELAYKYENIDNIEFNGFDEYYNFKEENKKYGVESYQFSRIDSYSRYVCVDGYGLYYIFKVITPGDYSVILDNHTIDLPEFTEKYNSTRSENKVGMNIEKIKDALNTQDYKYVYEKLDETFKENYYPTQASLENFIKNNLFENNNFVYANIEEKNGLYIFTVQINDRAGKSTEVKRLNIVMQLNEGTDFTMSFSMQ